MNEQRVSLVSFVLQNKNKNQLLWAFRQMKDTRPSLEPSLILVDIKKPSINVLEKKFSGLMIQLFFFRASRLAKSSRPWARTVYRQKKSTTLKSFVALAFIPELDFEVGTTALCSETSTGRRFNAFGLREKFGSNIGRNISSMAQGGKTILH